jgi:two-component system, NtrC family, response regulator AtoC
MKHILVVDDDPAMLSLLEAVLSSGGFRVETAIDAKEALVKYSLFDADLVLTDLELPGMSGIELLREGKRQRPECRWVVLTAYGSIASAVEAMRSGASDYLTKPLSEPEALLHVIRRVLREAEAEQTISLLSEELGRQFPPPEVLFLGGEMQKIHQLVREVSPTSATVLITGPSGTGKELVARTIHQLSPRAKKPFITVHCAALAESVLESELFGHEKGSFTGATGIRKGRFELADGGTLFLDEIGEISQSMQVKLLRVLQERCFERVGGERSILTDIRVITATNRNLRAEVTNGKFREDLYYRINVFPLQLPSLIERREAIIPLAEYFTKKFSAAFNKKITGFTRSAHQALSAYSWPGNIRELQNVIERAIILAHGEIDARHFNLETPGNFTATPKGILQINERETIKKVLAEVGGNRKQAALRLGISVRTLHYRIKEYNLT